MADYLNAKTRQVQHVSEGTLLHRLVEANPNMYEPVDAEVKDERTRKPGRRRSSAPKAADD